MPSRRITRATSRFQSQTTDPLFSDPPAAHTEDEADEGSKDSSNEENTSSEPSEDRDRRRQSKDDEHAESDDDDFSDGDEISLGEPDATSTPRLSKGKEKEHTPSDTEDEEERGEYENSTERRSSDDEEGSEEIDIIDEENLPTNPDTIFHWQIWDKLVSHANRNGRLFYAYEPRRGSLRDVTAFERSQARWGEARGRRPAILSQWDPTLQNNPTYKIGIIDYNGRTVLDWQGNTIRAFKGLPLTISSAVAGFRVEAWMRSDNRMQYRDIEARMHTKVGLNGREPIYGRRALASRASNFRDRAGCVCWSSRRTQLASKAYMDSLRTAARRANNLTTDHDLTNAQLAAFHALTRAKPSKQTHTAGLPDQSTPSASHGHSRSRSTNQVQTVSSASRHRTLRSNAEPLSERPGDAPAIGLSEETPEDILSDNEPSDDERYPDSYTSSDSEDEAVEVESTLSEFPSDEPEDPSDSRNDTPNTIEEAQILQQALDRTIREFYELTQGRAPVQAPPEENYFSQWYHYQSQFAIVWRQLGNIIESPPLFGLPRWTGGIANWETANETSVLGIER